MENLNDVKDGSAMNRIELTMVQALKILWSFFWRSWILMMPIMILVMFALRFILSFPKPGEPPDLKQMPLIFVMWAAMMIVSVVSQGFALRWALKARWSDFRIISVKAPTEPDDNLMK